MRAILIFLAAVSLFPGLVHARPAMAEGRVLRLDARLDRLISPRAPLISLAQGFVAEGPLWRPGGELWVTNLTDNTILALGPRGASRVVLRESGGVSDLPPSPIKAANGLTAGPDGSVYLAQQGARRIGKLNPDGSVAVVVATLGSKRLNSPNDLVFGKDGALYFTDPDFAFTERDDPDRDLPFSGVFRLKDGRLTLLISDLAAPNGLAISADGRTLYVSNSRPQMLWMAYDLSAQGEVSNPRLFARAGAEAGSGSPDGVKLDASGNLWGAGPGGVWVFSPEGATLGRIRLEEGATNLAWGEDGRTLFITSRNGVYSLRTRVRGQR